MTSKGIVYAVETKPGQYDNLKVPENWELVKGELDLQPSKNWLFEKYPNEETYCLLCDDLRPRTQGFDKIIEREADSWFLIDTHDDWLANHSARHDCMSGAFAWGGELVRTVGWWGFPYVRQAGNDNAWIHMFYMHFRLRKRLYDVMVEHLQYKNNKRPKDETDLWERDGVPYIRDDFKKFQQWQSSPEPGEIVKRVKQAMEKCGVEMPSKA